MRTRIKRLLQSSLGQPNHPFFAFFVVALLSTSLIFDVVSYLTRDVSYARAALYVMAVGLAAALIAIPTGLAWYVDIDPRVPARRVAMTHLRLNLVITGLFVINFLWRVTIPQHTVTPAGPLVLSVAGVAILMRSGHLGGQLVYRYGIGRQKR